jgi:acetylornithine deacetylase/succinyl-diaminopimelate desuccinylase-like protein
MRKIAPSLLLACLPLGGALADADSDQRAEARAIYARAVAFDTSVSGAQTPQLAAYLRDLFLAAGIPASDTLIVPYERTASLLVRYRGDGRGGRPILLLAHMDVVEARREDWQRDPFTLVEENGFFYGRGTFDNKAGLVNVTATLLRFKREAFVPARDLVLVFTGDEEVAQATARQLVREHRDWLDAELALNTDNGQGSLREADGRPAVYLVNTAEKTFASYRLTVRNPGGHSARPRRDNAIYELADALLRIRAYEFPVQWNDTTLSSFRAEAAVRSDAIGAALRRFAERPGAAAAVDTLSASPDHVGQIRTTCVATLIAGGHADNALPQSAAATVNCRIFPGVPPSTVEAQLEQLAGAGVEVAPVDDIYWSDASPLRDDVLQAVRAAVDATHPGVPVTPSMGVGTSDSLFFRAAGIPTYGTGEIFIKGSDDFAHGLDERVPVASFYDGLVHWRTLLLRLAGTP